MSALSLTRSLSWKSGAIGMCFEAEGQARTSSSVLRPALHVQLATHRGRGEVSRLQSMRIGYVSDGDPKGSPLQG